MRKKVEDVVERLRDGVVLVLVTLCKRVHYLSVAVGDDGVFFLFLFDFLSKPCPDWPEGHVRNPAAAGSD